MMCIKFSLAKLSLGDNAFSNFIITQLTEEEQVTSELTQSESSNISTTDTKSSSSSVVASTTPVIKQGRATYLAIQICFCALLVFC